MMKMKTVWRNKYIITTFLLCVISAFSFAIVKLNASYNSKEDDYVVVTSFYPMYIATLNITENANGVEVKNLTNNVTGCLHDYQLSTKDLKMLDGADMLVINGAGMEHFLEDIIDTYKELEVVEATKGLPLLKGKAHVHEEVHTQEDEDSMHEEHETEDVHEEEHETENVHEENEEAHTHDMESSLEVDNAHSWMDIKLYREEVKKIYEALAKANPENKELYKNNYENYDKELQKLCVEIEQLKELTKETKVVTFHDAFVYLKNMCGFEIKETINMDDENMLSAAQVGEIIDLVESGEAEYLITDENEGKAAAKAIAEETDVKIIYLNPLVSGEDNAHSYIDGMKENIERLKEAFN